MLQTVLRIRIRDPMIFYPPDPGSRSGMLLSRIPDPFVNSLYTKIGRIRDPVLFYPPDPRSGSGMEQWSDPDPGYNIPDPQHWLQVTTNVVQVPFSMFSTCWRVTEYWRQLMLPTLKSKLPTTSSPNTHFLLVNYTCSS
jgi:hypothetical protein